MEMTDHDRSNARAFWWLGREQGALRSEAIDAGPIRVRARFGTLSRGTERLVATGNVPESEWARMACPSMGGSFPFPVKYGYCVVGRVESGPAEWLGRTVFTLHPHQDWFTVADETVLTLIPDTVPPERAVLLANLETALNAAWDAGLVPGMNVAVIGAGVLGCLFARIARRTAGVDVRLIDTNPARRALADALDVPITDNAVGSYDLVVEATGNPGALNTALSLCGLEATLLVLSWYGNQAAPIALGHAFHSQRVQVISSQVGLVASSMRPRVDFSERKRRALRLLDDSALDVLIGSRIRFEDLPIQALPNLVDHGDVRAPLIVYDTANE